jgi:LysM repeat protein
MLRKFLFTALPALFLRILLNAGGGVKNVFDRGSRPHATGSVRGSIYTVAADDTFYSIGLRFGLPYQEILQANNLAEGASVSAGYKVTIPGLQPTDPPIQPPPVITPPPVKPPVGRPFLAITSPTPGSTLNPRYTVIITGTGSNLRGDNVLVRVKDPRGPTIKSQNTAVDAFGNWRAEFKDGVPATAGTEGIIEAESPGSSLKVSVNVHYR